MQEWNYAYLHARIYRLEITNLTEFIGGLIDELLDELHNWN
jgi:hypothetical protein